MARGEWGRRAPLVVSLAVLAALAPAVLEAAPKPVSQPLRRYIVVLDGAAAATAATHAATYAFRVSHLYEHALQGYAARMTPEAAGAIGDLPGVLWVQRDRIVRAASERVPTGVRRVGAGRRNPAGVGGRPDRVNADVAVLDTGIDLDHPDINVHKLGANCTAAGVVPLSVPEPEDAIGHGTHVAGTIAALDNRFGVVGVAPGARVWPVKVLFDNGRGFESMLLCGVDYVTARAGEIEVANLSLVMEGRDDGNCGRRNRDALHSGICRSVKAGVTYVVAAGNGHRNASRAVPAAYGEVITVSALADLDGRPGGRAGRGCRNRDDTFASFSNFGEDVDLIAPGACILSTWLGGRYARRSGTSMATAHVSGAAALYLATRPHASPPEVHRRLVASGRYDWRWPSRDGDAVKEPRVDVRTL